MYCLFEHMRALTPVAWSHQLMPISVGPAKIVITIQRRLVPAEHSSMNVFLEREHNSTHGPLVKETKAHIFIRFFFLYSVHQRLNHTHDRRILPSSFFSSSLGASSAVPAPPPAAAPPAAGAAAPPPDPTFRRRSLTSLPSSALL